MWFAISLPELILACRHLVIVGSFAKALSCLCRLYTRGHVQHNSQLSLGTAFSADVCRAKSSPALELPTPMICGCEKLQVLQQAWSTNWQFFHVEGQLTQC